MIRNLNNQNLTYQSLDMSHNNNMKNIFMIFLCNNSKKIKLNQYRGIELTTKVDRMGSCFLRSLTNVAKCWSRTSNDSSESVLTV